MSADGAALPITVELHSVGEGAAEGNGYAATESRPPTGNAPRQGGGRHGVATEHKRAGGEAGVVEGREVGAESEGEMRAADHGFGKGCGGGEARKERSPEGRFNTETPTRAEVGIGDRGGARNAGAEHKAVTVDRGHAVTSRSEPKRAVVATAHGDQRLAEIVERGGVGRGGEGVGGAFGSRRAGGAEGKEKTEDDKGERLHSLRRMRSKRVVVRSRQAGRLSGLKGSRKNCKKVGASRLPLSGSSAFSLTTALKLWGMS